MSGRLVVALDGHDGSGKTTLAGLLGARLGGRCVRPFAGAAGAELMRAGERGSAGELVSIASQAIADAVASVPPSMPVVLDRGWMTVASFVPASEAFFSEWPLWIPTALCWADLPATVERLALRRDEDAGRLEWHRHYLQVYMDLALRSGSLVLRTDRQDVESCLDQLEAWASASPGKPRFTGD